MLQRNYRMMGELLGFEFMQGTMKASITTTCLQHASGGDGSKNLYPSKLPNKRRPRLGAFVRPVLDLVVTCTNRKRHVIPAELSLRNVRSKDLHRRADA